ncbi:MAG: hypothetical protein JWP35_588 [Caulobacter sp.]|nr:hypothetical protein [Caulobacter sp.]
MRDRFLLPLMVLTGLGMIALSMVWPQGQGAPSPAPFTKPLAPLEAPEAATPAPSFDPLRAMSQPEPKKAEPQKAEPKKPAAKTPAKPGDLGLRPAQ